MYNPYQTYNPYMQQTALPQQQIVQVNGKASVDTIHLAPNSSLLAMDTTAPIVWMCVSDGVGKVTCTPYDITVHQEKQPVDMSNMEERLSSVEKTISELEVKLNDKSDDNKPKSKPYIPNNNKN